MVQGPIELCALRKNTEGIVALLEHGAIPTQAVRSHPRIPNSPLDQTPTTPLLLQMLNTGRQETEEVEEAQPVEQATQESTPMGQILLR
jgi:hypothetical protein